MNNDKHFGTTTTTTPALAAARAEMIAATAAYDRPGVSYEGPEAKRFDAARQNLDRLLGQAGN